MSIVATSSVSLVKVLNDLDEFDLELLRSIERGPVTCTELAGKFQRIYSVVWKRLKKLREAGFVRRSARRGKTGQAFYTACTEKIRVLFALLS